MPNPYLRKGRIGPYDRAQTQEQSDPEPTTRVLISDGSFELTEALYEQTSQSALKAASKIAANSWEVTKQNSLGKTATTHQLGISSTVSAAGAVTLDQGEPATQDAKVLIGPLPSPEKGAEASVIDITMPETRKADITSIDNPENIMPILKSSDTQLLFEFIIDF